MKWMKKTLLFAFALLFMIPPAFSASAKVDVGRVAQSLTFQSKQNENYELPYRLYLPASYDPGRSYPVVLFLHGAGERGTDNRIHVNKTVQNLFDTNPELLEQTIVICPQCPPNEQWVDYPWANGNYSSDQVKESKALSTAYEILQSVMTAYSCDADRIYAMGISMGGYGTWDLLVRHGDIFAAAVPLCGGGDASKADYLKDIPIWTYHGTADPTVQYAGTQGMYDAIIAAGGQKITFTTVERGEHNIWDEATTNPQLIEWLFAQKRSDRIPAEEPVPEKPTDTVPEQTPDTTSAETPWILWGAVAVGGTVIVALGIIIAIRFKKRKG